MRFQITAESGAQMVESCLIFECPLFEQTFEHSTNNFLISNGGWNNSHSITDSNESTSPLFKWLRYSNGSVIQMSVFRSFFNWIFVKQLCSRNSWETLVNLVTCLFQRNLWSFPLKSILDYLWSFAVQNKKTNAANSFKLGSMESKIKYHID